MIVSQMVDEHHLSIYRATLLIEQGRVELVHEGRIKTSSPPVYWDLWNGFVSIFQFFVITTVFLFSEIADIS